MEDRNIKGYGRFYGRIVDRDQSWGIDAGRLTNGRSITVGGKILGNKDSNQFKKEYRVVQGSCIRIMTQ